MLFKTPYDSSNRPLEDWRSLPDSLYTWPEPDKGIIDQFISLGVTEFPTVSRALRPLLKDESVTVSAGALYVLSALGDTINAQGANLRGANLNGIILREVDFSDANLQESNFEEAFLINVNFNGANLIGANLSGACLEGSSFYEANLSDADLSLTGLTATEFGSANLTNSDLGYINPLLADFTFANFTDARNLEINRLCDAYHLALIKPDSLSSLVEATCPNRLDTSVPRSTMIQSYYKEFPLCVIISLLDKQIGRQGEIITIECRYSEL